MDEYIIVETDDFNSILPLIKENGMGGEIDDEMPERIIKIWRMEEPQTGNLMAASTLEIRDGVYTLGKLAVRPDLHMMGYGRIMQSLVIDEAKKRHISQLWVCAKEPDYYLHNGWKIADWDSSPNIAIHCKACNKFAADCSPKKMRFFL